MSSGDLWRQEHSFEQIMKEHAALASKIAKNYKDKGTDWDDLKQLAHIGLYQAFLHYDPDKAVKFSTYAVYWMKKQVLGAFGDKTAYNATEYDEPQGRVGRRSDPRSFNIATACDTTLDADHEHASMKLPADMPPLERQIINLSIGQQLSLKEISAKLQLSVERVKQHKQKALRRLKAIHPGGV